jgi:hypothetical protein
MRKSSVTAQVLVTMKIYRALALVAVSLAACSPAPTPQADTGVAADVTAQDTNSPDTASPEDVTPPSDTGVTADTGVSSDALRCGMSMSICGPSQVCCAATGPTSPERCVDATMCATIRCEAAVHCPGLLEGERATCCTDGIQSTCRPVSRCGFRACRTVSDCNGGEQCCPFGAGQRRCGSC